MDFKTISVCSFGSTGSSAACDYLCEYDSLQVLDRTELTWVVSVDGLIDLDWHVNFPHGRRGESMKAIERYEAMMDRFAWNHRGMATPEKVKCSVRDFIRAITQVSWYTYTSPSTFFEKYVAKPLLQSRLYPFLEKKYGVCIHRYPKRLRHMSIKPDNFDELAKAHVKEILTLFGADFGRPLVLDQSFSGGNPQACFKYFENPYAIVVDRDPRDNYIFAKTKLLGKNSFMACDNVEDFVKYYRSLRHNQPYINNDRVLVLRFEDLVYNYQKTTECIRLFLDLPENPAPKSIFDPDLSIANTQVFKRFPQFQKEVEYIEKELPDYLFDFSKFPEPDFTKQMFKGKSPKHN